MIANLDAIVDNLDSMPAQAKDSFIRLLAAEIGLLQVELKGKLTKWPDFHINTGTACF